MSSLYLYTSLPTRTDSKSKSEDTEPESPSLIPSNNTSETPNASKVVGLNFDSDSASETMGYPVHGIVSERKQLEIALQMSVKKEPTTPKKSGREKVQTTLNMQNWLSRSPAESTRLRSKGIVSSQGENKRT